MNKFFLIIILLSFFITGCSNNDELKNIKCEKTVKDVVNSYTLSSEYIIYYKNDVVESVKTTEAVNTENKELLESVKEKLEETYDAYNKTYGGYTYDIKQSDNNITAYVTIDYNKMNIKQFAEENSMLKSYMKDNRLTLDGMKALYNSMGVTCE